MPLDPDIISRGIRPWPTPLERQQQEIQLQSAQALAEERRQNAQRLLMEQEDRRRKYNARIADQSMIAQKRQTNTPIRATDFQDPETGKQYFEAEKLDAANNQEKIKEAQAKHGLMASIVASAKDAPEADRPAIVDRLLQQHADVLGVDTINELKQDLDLTDSGIDQVVKASMTVEQQLARADKNEASRHQQAVDNHNAVEDMIKQHEAYLKEFGTIRPFSEEVQKQKLEEKQRQENPGMSPTAFAQQEQLIKDRAAATAANEGAGISLTPAGLDAAALNFARTGQLPPMGMSKASAGTRAQIINRAAALYPNLDIASNKADFAANEGSLKALQRNRDAVVAFENTATKNLNLFVDKAKAVVDSGSPWINRPLRSIDQKVLGNTDLIAFNAARQVAINEIAKVTSNPGLSGQLSDSARREVEAFIPESATLKQVYAVANVLKADMKNRHDSLDEQIKAIESRIRQGGQGGNNQPTSGRIVQRNKVTGEYRHSEDGGKTWLSGK